MNDTKLSYFQRSHGYGGNEETDNYLNMSNLLSSENEQRHLVGSKSQQLLRQISSDRPKSYRYDAKKHIKVLKRPISCYLDEDSSDSVRVSECSNEAHIKEAYRIQNNFTPLIRSNAPKPLMNLTNVADRRKKLQIFV